ncbi:MAG: endopeptidase La [Rickettsiales bacterium]
METLPLLALRDLVVFPRMIVPLFVGRKRSIKALEVALDRDKRILAVAQKNGQQDSPDVDGLHDVGVVAHIMQLMKLPDDTVKVLIEGESRALISSIVDMPEGYMEARFVIHADEYDNSQQNRALQRMLQEQFEQYAKANKKISEDIQAAVAKIADPVSLCDTISSHMPLALNKKQEILAIRHLPDRMERLCILLHDESELLSTEQKIKARVKTQMERAQKEYYLNEQLKAIHKELNEDEDGRNEQQQYEERIKAVKLSPEAEKQARQELKRLKTMTPMSGEATVTRNYLDCLLDIPWHKNTRIRNDAEAAQKLLDDEHYGLEKVKERIVEYIAVLSRTKKLKGPVLCLIGPPGVGKTSLAASIAKATNRKFIKMSLGGVRDEAEIRGHRRTYIGSMPGKIIQSMRKVGASNPLFLLDEIDKMGHDYRGDPAAALLEVLDPEQNHKFNDHYLDVDYDLSDVMFVCTANSREIPHALLDRLEVIPIAGYTEQEKLEIAKRHLLPKQIDNHGLKKNELSITDDALLDVVRYYTREAGVRNFERELAKIARKSVRKLVAGGDTKEITVRPEDVKNFCGVRRFDYDRAHDENLVGVVNGLAYTQSGGDMLFIEAICVPGSGKIKSTGKLGEVMQESVQAAWSYVRARAAEFGIRESDFKKRDVHVHVPEGATPKDGPSAGVAMFVAATSAMSGVPVRRDVAMTGEITLRGRILAIGGLKEKLLAALRAGMTTVLIPKDNEKDVEELPDVVRNGLKILCVSHVDEMLDVAFAEKLSPLTPEEVSADAALARQYVPATDGAGAAIQ